MDAELLIKYEWDEAEKGFNMATLGESLIGFHAVLEEYFELSKIQGDFEIRTVKVREGSVELINILHVVLSGHPFVSIPALYDFLEATNPEALMHAKEFFSAIGNAGKTVDDYLNAKPFQGALVAGAIPAFMIYLLQKQQTRKDPDANRSIPRRYANKLDQMQDKNIYRRALKPLADGGFKRIKVAQLGVTSPKEVSIGENDLEDYLSDESQILPDFINGQEVSLIARVVGLQSTRGETVKLKVEDIDPMNNLLMAHPPDGKGTEHYRDMYGETVVLTAEVYRKSMYKRPELLIRSMTKRQSELVLDY